MKLTVLVDNNSWNFYGEWGLSFIIEDQGKKILFDLGETELFLKNAIQLKEDLRNIDYLVFSHGHHDHVKGIRPLIEYYSSEDVKQDDRPEVVAHSQAFLARRNPKGVDTSGQISEEELREHFEVNLQDDSLWLTDNLVFLGEIERQNNFENMKASGQILTVDGWQDDYILDDTGLVYKSSEGLVIIVGCSHSGICNIVDQAKRICNEERIVDIIGGFHLINPPTEQLDGSLQYMQKIKPKELRACHCTSLQSKIDSASVANLKEVGTGMVLEYK